MNQILTLNTGSSSLKAGVYTGGEPLRPALSVVVERIGKPGGSLRIGNQIEARDFADHAAALDAVLQILGQEAIAAAGHRVVHGGSRYSRPAMVDAELLQELGRLTAIDPMHLPQAIAAIQKLRQARPELPQVACFDTAFHRTMPAIAQRLPLPRELAAVGLIRYGFHGLSYEFVLHRLRQLGEPAVDGRAVMAHLGNGASMVAVRQGRSVDTTMGFTPTGGLVMGSRTGDLDPGVLLYLLQECHLTASEVSELVNTRAGLLGVSGRTGDMRELLEREAAEPAAAEAVTLFCYQAAKHLAALAGALGGLDLVVFTGGIGEHAAPVRQRICERLGFLGIQLDEQQNQRHTAVISRAGSDVTVRVVPTDEDLMIAEHTARLLWG